METPRAGIKLITPDFQLCGNQKVCFCPALGLQLPAAFIQGKWFMKGCPKHLNVGSLLCINVISIISSNGAMVSADVLPTDLTRC